MTTRWLLRTETWSKLPPGARQAYVVIVSSYGGQCDRDGHGHFRKYSSAEICAHTLRHRLGIRADVLLSATESRAIGAATP
jgi:hypothetical protein